jgi:hypothetical protein
LPATRDSAEIDTAGSTLTETMVDREITVSKAETLTFDARPGRLVSLTVNDPHAVTSEVVVAVGSPATGSFQYAASNGAATYVVPGTLPSGWEFYAMADMSSVTASGSPVEYGLIKVVKGAIPASPAWSSSISGLATLHATVRRLNPGDTESLGLTPEVAGPYDLYYPSLTSIWYDGATPYAVQFRLTPGYAWQQQGPYGDAVMNNAPVWGAHQYYETFGAATFSPDWQVMGGGVQVSGNTLYAGTSNGNDLLVDPAFASFTGDSSGLPASATATLYQGTKLIATGGANGASATIPPTTKWYREHVVAQPASGLMFRQVTLDYTFQAAAQPNYGGFSPNYVVPTIKPSGLDLENAAKPGTKTTVPISLTDYAYPFSIGVHSVQVWASGNGGKTWAALNVSHSGGTWTVTVTNPATVGYVSLRVRAALSDGTTTEVTVINAYAIS